MAALTLRFAGIALCVVLVHARGPLCLHCEAVINPKLCNNVIECQSSESCFSEHFIYENGTQAFTFGCRITQQCPDQIINVQRRFDLTLCEKCCKGDLCNNNICTNGTEPPSGIPCLTCSNVDSTTNCFTLSYCTQGKVCYTEMSMHSEHLTFNMGCLRKEICNAFEIEIIGKREVLHHPCHECCEKPGCNNGACAHSQTTTGPQTTASATAFPPPRDCWDLMNVYNHTKDGVYKVVLPTGRIQSVRCDMTTDGGGWTVFQRRYDGTVNFDQSYSTYARGFGYLPLEFWMGNDLLHQFTAAENQTLRVDLCDWDNVTRHAIYDSFSVASQGNCFRLGVSGYHGNARDAMHNPPHPGLSQDNMCFTAFDVDNDAVTNNNCGQLYHSGWWFNNCYRTNLNGIYRHMGRLLANVGVEWFTWRTPYSYKQTEMKFRPSSVARMTNEQFRC